MTPADRGGQGCRHRPGMAVDKWRGQWSLFRRHGILSYGCMFSVSVELYCTCTGLYICTLGLSVLMSFIGILSST